MDLVVFEPNELLAVARALRHVGQTNEVFTKGEADFVSAIAAMHGVDLDPQTLAPIEPHELAAAVVDPHKRKRALQLLVVMAFVEGEVDRRAQDVLSRFSEALGIEERGLEVVREVAHGQHLLARFDMIRRLRGTLIRDKAFDTLKSMATAAILGEDREVVEKYRVLAEYPKGTLGRELYESWQEHGFGLPGEKGSMPERGVFHDVGHILSGYGVDPAGEIRQGAFQAGFVRKDGFAFFLFAVLQFHAGVKITPIANAERGYFDAKEVLRAAQRGASCSVDLSDPDAWDFWSVARVPVTELRERYGIPGA